MDMSFICDQTWASLQGTDKKRRSCEVCDKPVYNLSGMTRKQARALLASYGENPPCIRFVSRNGEIIHDGDPFQQLRDQRNGAKVLLAAAAAVHVGFASMSADPLVALVNPFTVASTIFLGPEENDPEIMGEMAAPEPDIMFAPGELNVCASETQCLQAVRDAVLRAQEHKQAEGPHALYDEARELTKAEHLLELIDRKNRPEDLENLSVQAYNARQEIEVRIRDSRATLHTLIQHKKYEEARQECRQTLSLFSDHRNKWARIFVDRERELIDIYGLPLDPQDTIPPD
jgi:hypothetical protein